MDAPLSHISIRPLQQSQCQGCKSDATVPNFRFAFQPIVNLATRRIYAHEALVRGLEGQSAYSILSQIDSENQYLFDQRCRTQAIKEAVSLSLDGFLSINFLPNAVYRPEACIRSTLEAAEKYGFDTKRIIFETIEGENILNRPHLVGIFKAYRQFGFQTAIDDFGAGYSGLSLLTEFQPDIIKLDMDLIRNIDTNSVKQAIISGLVKICKDLGIRIIAEGVETKAERDFLISQGISLMQGYYFSKPILGTVPLVPFSCYNDG